MRLGASPLEDRLGTSQPVLYLGDYEVLDEIARGGMGVIYLARQLSLNRMVAVKMLLGGQFANPTFIRRFRREAEAAASLNHPSIVAIYEVGEHLGQPYFSMELVEGRNLAELCRDNSLPESQAAKLVKTIAEGVHFAHLQGVLHRDLKPSNVLVDKLGNPHITDFGLAKRTQADADLTLTGQVLGTPNYMSPEQADPTLGPTTVASDVYSIGAILYHLLTGRPPYLAHTIARTLQLAVEGEPVSPRLLNRNISHDLETICLKSLESDPLNRYHSALHVARELECFLNHEPISARPISALAKAVRWRRRKPGLAAALGGLTILLLIVLIGSPSALYRIHGERRLSDIARKQEVISRHRAESAEHEARQQLYSALVEQAEASVRTAEMGQRSRALDSLKRASAISNSITLQTVAMAALGLPDLSLEREFPTGPAFTLVQLAPGFESVALARGVGPVEIRSTSDWQFKETLPASTNLPVFVARWSPDNSFLAIKRDYDSSGASAALEVWDMRKSKLIMVIPSLSHNAVSFHPRAHQLLCAQTDGTLSTWDLDRGLPLSTSHLPTANHLHYSPTGQFFATEYETGTNDFVAVYDSATGKQQAAHAFTDSVLDIAWEPAGNFLALASADGSVYLMNAHHGEVRALGNHKAQAVSTRFSPEGDYLFSGGWEGEVICWDMRTRTRSFTIDRQSWNLQFCADGRTCALISRSHVQLYRFERPINRQFREDLGPRLRRAAFSPDGHLLAAAADQQLGVWDLNVTGSSLLVSELPEAHPSFTADGLTLLASGRGERCAGWRVLPGLTNARPPVLRSIEYAKPDGYASVAVASNLVALSGATGSRVSSAEQLEFNTSPTAKTLEGISAGSPDGRWLGIYRSFTRYLHVYALPAVEPVALLTNHAKISDVAFAPFGDELAVSSPEGVEFWSTTTWTKNRSLTNFTGILFGHDTSAFWLTKDFRNAGLYDAKTLAPLFLLPSGTLPLAVSADGRLLAVSVESRRLQVWDLDRVRAELSRLGLSARFGSASQSSTRP